MVPVCTLLRLGCSALIQNYPCRGPELQEEWTPTPPRSQPPESWLKPTAELGGREDSMNKAVPLFPSPTQHQDAAILVESKDLAVFFSTYKKKSLMGVGRARRSGPTHKQSRQAPAAFPTAVTCPSAHALSQGLVVDGSQVLPPTCHHPLPTNL